MLKKLRSQFAALLCLCALFTAFSVQAGIPSGMLDQDDPSLAPILEGVMPAVVNVVVKTKSRTEEQNPLFANPFFRHFFDLPEQPPVPRQRMAAGSGVIIDADKGIIITNNHVVNDAETITVRLNDGREFNAELVGKDSDSDLAVIQIDAENLTELPLGDSDRLRVGDFVIAIGNPFGLAHTVTSGIISGLGRHGLSGLGSRYGNFIQTDASINPGNSGGALINLDGEVIGINTAILSQSGGNIGIGFAIPSNLVKKIYHQIMEYGEVRRGRLGVIGQNLTNDLAEAFGLDNNQGVVVAQVEDNSPAEEAGIKARDVIIAVDGKQIKDFSDLARAIGLRLPGSDVTITLIRDGEEKTVTTTLGSAAEESEQQADSSNLNEALAGAQFTAIPEGHPLAGKVEGIMVRGVSPGSPAARAGLRPNDIITSVNRQQVTSLEQFRKLVSKDSGRLLLHIRRQGGALFLLIE